jgi:hypothetical protein
MEVGGEGRHFALVLRARGRADECRDLFVAQARERHTADAVDPCKGRKRIGELRSHVLAPVTVRREQEEARVGHGVSQMDQEMQ